jgi:hypothetical protein
MLICIVIHIKRAKSGVEAQRRPAFATFSENGDTPSHVSGEFARGDFKTSKLQLAAAMPPPARKHTVFKDNNRVVLEVLF